MSNNNRKGRGGLMGFDDVAKVDKTEQIEKPEAQTIEQPTPEAKPMPEQEVKPETNTKDEFTALIDMLDDDVPPQRRQISVYLDVDVYRAFEKWGKKRKKGDKSALINEFLRKAMKL